MPTAPNPLLPITPRPRCPLRIRRTRRQGHDFVICRAAHGIACRIRIIGRPLAAGALSQDAAKPQENEHRERQEDDGIDIEHVSRSFGGATCGSAHPSGGSQRRIHGKVRFPLYVGTHGAPSRGSPRDGHATESLNDPSRRANVGRAKWLDRPGRRPSRCAVRSCSGISRQHCSPAMPVLAKP